MAWGWRTKPRSVIKTIQWFKAFEELDGEEEGVIIASRLAEKVNITRSVIVNALRKFESAGVIETRSNGMKGTYIKVINELAYNAV